jgi:hypothetical protein
MDEMNRRIRQALGREPSQAEPGAEEQRPQLDLGSGARPLAPASSSGAGFRRWLHEQTRRAPLASTTITARRFPR